MVTVHCAFCPVAVVEFLVLFYAFCCVNIRLKDHEIFFYIDLSLLSEEFPHKPHSIRRVAMPSGIYTTKKLNLHFIPRPRGKGHGYGVQEAYLARDNLGHRCFQEDQFA
ncbi:hypothetical protein AAMO2058_000469800 [Amorphochlora amoebiformis]